MKAEQGRARQIWSQIWPPSLIFLLYCALAVLITWPVLARLNEAIPGSEGDSLNHLWTFRWVKQALFDGVSPFYTWAMYYPDGVSLLTHNIAWVHIAAWIPLQAIVGEAAAYSLVFLLIFPLNGIAMYFLAKELSGSHMASFIGGLIVAFWPYILSHHNHPNLILIAWALFSLIFLRRLMQRGRLKDAVITAMFLALIGLTRWQMLLISAPLLASFLLWEFTVGKVKLTRRLAGLLLVSAAGALLLMGPLLTPVVTNQLTIDNPDDLFVVETPHETDLLAYLLPNRYHPLWGESVIGWYDNVGVNKTFTPFLGFSVLILALIGSWRKWKESRFWLLTALIYLLLALGSSLRFNGIDLIPLPGAWLEELFLFQVIRHPDRLNVMLSLPLGMLATFGTQSLIESFSTRDQSDAAPTAVRSSKIGIIVTAICAVLILGEYAVRYPLYQLDTPEWYKLLAQEPGNFAILDLPLGSRSYDKEYMLHQITHGKSLVGGHVSRVPVKAYALINRVPLLQSQRESPTDPPELSNVSHQLGLLQAEDVRYLVLHKKFLTDEEEVAWQTWLVRPPFYADNDLLVYKTAVLPGEVLISQAVSDANGDYPAIGLIGSNVSPRKVVPGGWARIDLDWSSESDIEKNYNMCLQFNSETDQLMELCEPLAPDWPTSRWQAGEIVHRSYVLPMDPFWPAGVYSIAVSLQNGENITKPAVVGSLIIDGRQRQFNPPRPMEETEVIWGDVIRLVGFDISSADTLNITFYWNALRRMEASYKVFVHVIDSSDGSLVAQTDYIPQEWTYPTTWWDSGEYIADYLQLPLLGLQGDQYEIVIGLYDSVTGERLPAYASDGSTYVDAVVPLTALSVPK